MTRPIRASDESIQSFEGSKFGPTLDRRTFLIGAGVASGQEFPVSAMAQSITVSSSLYGRVDAYSCHRIPKADLGHRLSIAGPDVRGSGGDRWARYSACLLSRVARMRFFTLDRRCTHTWWLMEKINCRTGMTQIGRVLAHAGVENARQRVQALVFVGDAMEETPADLYAAARELGLPVFLFQEGDDSEATRVFREIARLTKGAHCRFDPGSGKQLGELLRAVATYAAGGRQALLASGNAGALKLLEQREQARLFFDC